jgi:hypothetical protein
LLEDTVRLEVNRAYNEQLWARREKIGPKCHPDDDEGKGGGVDTPSDLKHQRRIKWRTKKRKKGR